MRREKWPNAFKSWKSNSDRRTVKMKGARKNLPLSQIIKENIVHTVDSIRPEWPLESKSNLNKPQARTHTHPQSWWASTKLKKIGNDCIKFFGPFAMFSVLSKLQHLKPADRFIHIKVLPSLFLAILTTFSLHIDSLFTKERLFLNVFTSP